MHVCAASQPRCGVCSQSEPRVGLERDRRNTHNDVPSAAAGPSGALHRCRGCRPRGRAAKRIGMQDTRHERLAPELLQPTRNAFVQLLGGCQARATCQKRAKDPRSSGGRGSAGATRHYGGHPARHQKRREALPPLPYSTKQRLHRQGAGRRAWPQPICQFLEARLSSPRRRIRWLANHPTTQAMQC